MVYYVIQSTLIKIVAQLNWDRGISVTRSQYPKQCLHLDLLPTAFCCLGLMWVIWVVSIPGDPFQRLMFVITVGQATVIRRRRITRDELWMAAIFHSWQCAQDCYHLKCTWTIVSCDINVQTLKKEILRIHTIFKSSRVIGLKLYTGARSAHRTNKRSPWSIKRCALLPLDVASWPISARLVPWVIWKKEGTLMYLYINCNSLPIC